MYSLKHKELLDPIIADELESLIARFTGVLQEEHNVDGSHLQRAVVSAAKAENAVEGPKNTDGTGQLVQSNVATQGQHWKSGPWTLDDATLATTAERNKVGIIPPKLSGGTYHNYAPDGIDNAILLEIEPDVNTVTLTGIKAVSTKRLLFLRNRDSSLNLILKHASTSSAEGNRFDLPNNADITLLPGQLAILYFDPNRGAWTAGPGTQALAALPNALVKRRWCYMFGNTNNNNFTATGAGSNTITSSGSTGTPEFGADGPWHMLGSSGTTVHGYAGMNASGGSGLARRANNPQIDFEIKTSSDITSQRLWLGFNTSGTSGIASSDTAPDTDIALFRFSTAAGDNGWVPCTRNSVTTTVGSAIGTVVANTVYKLRIRLTDTAAYFSVNGGAETTISTTLPRAASNMWLVADIESLVAAQRNLLFSTTLMQWGAEWNL